MSNNSPKSAKRYIFNTPVHDIDPQDIKDVITSFLESSKPIHIVYLSWWGLIRGIFNWGYRSILRNATLIIPTSTLIVFGARVLKYNRLSCHSSFDFTIKILSILEANQQSIYLLGTEVGQLQIIEKNINNTFPELMIVGRFPGYFSPQHEQPISTAIRKSRPKLLLVGSGVPSNELWVYKIKHKIHPCILIWSDSVMNILAMKTKKPATDNFTKILTTIKTYVRKPWRLYRFLIFIGYFFALIFWRIFRI